MAGGVRCWGDNRWGQAAGGDNTEKVLATPPARDLLADVKAVAAGAFHTCVLMLTGSVRCWGNDSYGQLGDGSTIHTLTGSTGDVLTGAQAISAGADHTCALMTTGGVRCWGRNDSGQTGDGTTVLERPSPPTSDVLTDLQAIAAGDAHTCALMASGGVRCWGGSIGGTTRRRNSDARTTKPCTRGPR